MKSQVQKTKIAYLGREESPTIKEYTAVQIVVENLANTVTFESRKTQLNYESLKDSVTERLINPLIVISNTLENYEHAVEFVVPEYIEPFDPSKEWLVLMGNQRLSILLPKGIEDISCFIVDAWVESVVLTKKLNWQMNEQKT